jgi:teichoic acid transport system permease protein
VTTTSTDLARLADRGGLRPLGGRPQLRQYLTQLWQRRFFTFELARSRFRAENEADRLGAAWIVLRPLINAAVYGFIFGYLITSKTRPTDFVPFLVIGVFIFQYFASCFQDGAKSIISNMGLITSLHFPRAVLPIAVVIQQLLGLVWMIALMCILVLLSGDPILWQWWQIIPALFLMTLFNIGIACLAARLTIHLRDIAQLIPFITRIIFYLSGIFFLVDRLPAPLWAKHILELNPVTIYITLCRVALLGAKENETVAAGYNDVHEWLWALAWAVGTLVIGFLFFWRAEDRYGRD